MSEGIKEEIETQGLELLGVMPQDDTVYRFDSDGRPIVEIPKEAPVRKAFDAIVRKLKFD